MPFDVVSYVLARRAVTKHTHVRADIVDLLPIRRADLEYPTENVSFAYLHAIGKLVPSVTYRYGYAGVATADSFTDKAISCVMETGDWNVLNNALNARIADPTVFDNLYACGFDTKQATADFRIDKIVGGTATNLAYEAVDLADGNPFWVTFSIVGSTLKGWRQRVRDLTATPNVSVTDTSLASGRFGVGGVRNSFAELLAPLSRLPPALRIVEVEVAGSGTLDDPFRPNFAQQLDKHPELGTIDRLAVTWGAFDHKPEHSTMLIVVTGDNPYVKGAIEKQVEHAKSKGLRVLKPPKDYREAVEQHRELKKDFPEWIAGKDNYAYHVLGHEVFELFQVADTYHGNIVEGIKPQAYRNVPDWEMRRTLNTWKKRLERVNVLTEERDKHVKKIDKVLKLGW